MTVGVPDLASHVCLARARVAEAQEDDAILCLYRHSEHGLVSQLSPQVILYLEMDIKC